MSIVWAMLGLGISVARGALDKTPSLIAPSGGLYDANDITSWGSSNSTVTANAALSPDGTSNASTLIENGAASSHLAATGPAITVSIATATTTFSLYVSQIGSARNLLVKFNNQAFNANLSGTFNLGASPSIQSAPAVTGAWSSPSAGSITVPIAGWNLISMSCTTTTDTKLNPWLQLFSGTNGSYTGDGASGIAIWGVDIR